MAHTDGRDVGRLLDTLVPPLPAPPDRLDGIRRRAIRQRRAVAATAIAGLVLAVLGASALLPSSRPAPDQLPTSNRPGLGDCPTQPPRFPDDNGSLPETGPGELAAKGATEAIFCRYPSMPEYPRRRLVLTRDVAGLIAELNRLPSREGLDPCFSVGDGGYLTLVHSDGTSQIIELAGRCGYVRRGNITRHDGYLAVQAFDERYRDQELAAANPDTVTAADCPPRLTRNDTDRELQPEQVFDTWLRATGQNTSYLAGPAAIVTACRYKHNRGTEYGRTGRVSSRSAAARIDAAVQIAEDALPRQLPYFDCGPLDAVKTVDVLVIRDSVGETAEVRLPRDACQIVSFPGRDGGPPNGDLTSLLDELLGPA